MIRNRLLWKRFSGFGLRGMMTNEITTRQWRSNIGTHEASIQAFEQKCARQNTFPYLVSSEACIGRAHHLSWVGSKHVSARLILLNWFVN